jgi:hypothetical protein
VKVWVSRYRDFLVAFLQRVQQASGNTDIGQQILSILDLFPNLNNITINQLVQNNTELMNNFASWIKSLNAQFVARAPGMQNVKPGYRAIVAWVKNRMVQEFYAQIR